MILEGIVTSLNDAGDLNVAPMGPEVGPGFQRFVFRPFQTSATYRNLKRAGEGVFHVTDDVLLLARSAIGLPIAPETRPAASIQGRILVDACRAFEFRVVGLDDSRDRATIVAETVASHRHRDFFGLNRAKHAVVEAAILATRTHLLPPASILADLDALAVLVSKTGGPEESEAFALLKAHVEAAARDQGFEP